MNCKKARSSLNRYLDGELSAEQSLELEQHFDACRHCRGQLEAIRNVGDLLDMIPVSPVPEGFADHVMARARRRAPLAQRKRLSLRMDWRPLRWFADISTPMRVAACVMFLLGSLLGLSMSKEPAFSSGRPAGTLSNADMDGFEWFDPTPPASLGSAYFTLASTSMDEREAP